MTSYLIGGLVLMALGGLLLFFRKQALAKVEQLKATVSKSIGDLLALAKTGGSLTQQNIEVHGTITCASPLTAELSRKPCVSFRSEVQREYEETYYEKNNQTGANEAKTRKGHETVSTNRGQTPFQLKDNSGSIAVDPNGADIDEEQVLNKFEHSNALSGNTLNFGGFSISLGGNPLPVSGAKRILGYRLHEWILPVDRPAFVIGAVATQGGQVTMRQPTEKKAGFYISTRSKEALAEATGKQAKYLMIGTVLCELLGLGVIGYSFFS